jgi:hypothetical protein
LDLFEMHRLGLRPAPEDHAGYSRTNDGGWIVAAPGSETGIAEVRAQFAKAPKRGTAYSAPDPEGMANAFVISAAPDMLAALLALKSALRGFGYVDEAEAGKAWDMALRAIEKATTITHEGHATARSMRAND